jgi:hypothetical protein
MKTAPTSRLKKFEKLNHRKKLVLHFGMSPSVTP